MTLRRALAIAIILLVGYGLAKLSVEYYARVVVPLDTVSNRSVCELSVLNVSQLSLCPTPPPLLFLDPSVESSVPEKYASVYRYKIHRLVWSQYPVDSRRVLESDFAQDRELIRLTNGLVFAYIPTTHIPGREGVIDYVAMRRVNQQLRHEAQSTVLLVRHIGGMWTFPVEVIHEVSLMGIVGLSESILEDGKPVRYGLFSRSARTLPPSKYRGLFEPDTFDSLSSSD
jgi:hypothetical protein